MSMLSKVGFSTLEPTHLYTIVTVIKYDTYQPIELMTDTQKDTDQTHDRHAVDTLLYNTKKEKKVNNKEKYPNGYSSPGACLDDKRVDCPHKEIIETYHNLLPMLPHIQVWDDTSRKNLRARWRQEPKNQSLDFWSAYFKWVAESSFLVGKVNHFQADLHWLVRPTNFAKVINGRYHNNQNFHDKLEKRGSEWLQKRQETSVS